MKNLTVQESKDLFVYGCVPSRVILAILPLLDFTKKNEKFRNMLSYILMAMGIGFLIIYIFGLRKKGVETGGRDIWWNNSRPIHGLLFLSSGIFLLNKQYEISSSFIFIDLILGINGWVNNYY